MNIRKPKPIQGWQQFLVEMGTIDIGIALTAEQAIEAVPVRDRNLRDRRS